MPAPSRRGTCTNFTPAAIWNHSDVRCEVEPLPCVAAVTLPGLARANAMKSATLFALIFAGLTNSPVGIVAMIVTGTNCAGSNGSLA